MGIRRKYLQESPYEHPNDAARAPHARPKARAHRPLPVPTPSEKPLGTSITPTTGNDGISPLDLKMDQEAVLVRRAFTPTVRLRPHISQLLDDAYSIVGEELRRLRQKTEAGQALTIPEANNLSKYVDQLVKLAKTELEQEKRQDPSQLSDDEIHAMIEEAHRLGLLAK